MLHNLADYILNFLIKSVYLLLLSKKRFEENIIYSFCIYKHILVKNLTPDNKKYYSFMVTTQTE